MPPTEILSPFPDHVGFAFVSVTDGAPQPVHRDEEALLTPRSATRRVTSFRLGRNAAHNALARLGAPPAPVLRGQQREPLWPPGVVGAITHAAGCAVAAAAYTEVCGGIGVDLERRRPMEDVVHQIVFGYEHRSLRGVEEPELSDQIVAMFSAKESIYKAFFPRIGTFFGFDAVTLDPGDTGFDAHFTRILDGGYPPDRRFRVAVNWYDELVLTSVLLPPDD